MTVGDASPRPSRLVLVAGTGTEVGKTFVAAALARRLRAHGRTVAARKPAQSFDPADPEPTDAEVLGAATGEPPQEVCPPERWYPVPLAPPMAATRLGRAPVRLDDLVAALTWPPAVDVGLIETAGGVRAPQADDGDVVDLLGRVAPDDVLLVADAGLGTINHVRLSADALGRDRLHVLLNRYDPDDPLHVDNHRWLTERDGLTVYTSAEAVADHLHGRLPGA
ncbi:MAG: dethiobiotin synthase [Acidimicrobiales bacterium]|nr:dethiobiotin synthase [Acidimicrobiales bacterium]MCB1261227.1 dethiobiotin synthase [Acidimicrobiales bacterium]